MPKPDTKAVATHGRTVGSSPSTALSVALTAAVGLFSMISGPSAHGRDILRPGGGAAAPAGSGGGTRPLGPAAAAQLRAAGQDRLSRATQAIQSVKAMQAAARTAAQRGANNLGFDPARPGVRLPNVPNGLGPGGLQVAPGVPVDLKNPQSGEDKGLWVGAKLPQEKVKDSETLVTIKQTQQQAVLNWGSFNVGKETTLKFDQSAGGSRASKWVAFNKIKDPTGVPSQILGSIEAEGQVYVINPNGIIFGGSSQINLRTLVASSLPINDNLISRGLLNNPDAQFLFSGLSLPAGSATPAFTPDPSSRPDGRYGDVVVKQGAEINSASSEDNVGGRVALIGANVRNNGSISTPDGQTILAAGLQVGFAPHPSSDPSLRGLDVYIGAVATPPAGDSSATAPGYAGTSINNGLIDAPRANVTVAGKNVQQLGVINSSTSVALNGRIDLIADYDAVSNLESNGSNISSSGGIRSLDPYLFLPRSTGTVSLGPESVTQILPELASDETVVASTLALPSQINVQGRSIHLGIDSILLAPSGNVALSAGVWNFVSGNNQRTNFVYSGGQIYLDRGASIDVAGSTNISAPITQNILAVELRGAEFADSPLQRDGIFRGTTINIDIRQAGIYNGRTWIGTPLADASGYVGLISRTVGELTTPGGTVKMNAGESVIMQRGSSVDVSGGWIDYEGALVQTSRVVSGARLLDISQAIPDVIYDGFYSDKASRSFLKYGITETYTKPLALTGAHYEDGYRYGASGGDVSISAPAMALDGELLGRTVNGPRQRSVQAAPSSLSLSFLAEETTQPFPKFSPTPPDITFSSTSTLPAADAFSVNSDGLAVALRSDRRETVILSPDLLSSNGFSVLKIDNADGNISVPADVTISTPAGGTIALKGANISVEGSMIAPGGTLSFEVFNISQATRNQIAAAENKETPDPVTGRGLFSLGTTGFLSTAGLIVDDGRGSTTALGLPVITNGGSITIAGYDVELEGGATIDVSGGLAVSATNQRSYGNAGSISISAGQDAAIRSVLGGSLSLASTLLGLAGGQGGALSLTAPSFQIGGSTDRAGTVLLTPEFFSRGGFGSFSLTGLGEATNVDGEFVPGIRIVQGTAIRPVALSAIARPRPDGSGLALVPVVKPEGMRTPVSLSFAATGVTDQYVSTEVRTRGDLVMEQGVTISTDALGSVALSGNRALVLGSIFAPGGSISITGKNTSALELQNSSGTALVNVFLGRNTVLSTAGTAIVLPDRRGNRTGAVLNGGTIAIAGNVFASTGSTLDVSGASGVLDLAPAYSRFLGTPGTLLSNWNITGSLAGAPVVATRIESNGGAISLIGDQALFTDATLLGAAGGASARGGSLSISSGRYISPTASEPSTPLDVTLEVQQLGKVLVSPGAGVLGNAFATRTGDVIEGRGYVGVDSFSTGGFDSLELRGTVRFDGQVQITVPGSLRVADGGVVYADSRVNLTGSHVAIGTAFRPPLSPLDPKNPFTLGSEPFHFVPTYGSGKLNVSGALIDIGNLSLQNIGRVNFLAQSGDIRGNGTLSVAGDIFMGAGQIYTPTATEFTISAVDYSVGEIVQAGTVTFASSGARSLPLAAGGTLNVYASEIRQGGVLRAPLGTINLGWNGEGTAPIDLITGQAVAITKQLTLASGSVTSVSSIDPATGQAVVIPFGINKNGTTWIDPTGTDITAGNLASKEINISALNVSSRAGSQVDIGGGGDLYAFRWVQGAGGSTDILASSGSFAVIPGYGSGYAPYAPFNNGTNGSNLGGDLGYVNSGLSVGDQVYLSGSNGLAAGYYTLLPARYALLPGAYLVTPRKGAPSGTYTLPDSSNLVPGYRFNGMTGTGGQPLTSWFEVNSTDVVRARAEYQDYSANGYLAQRASELGIAAPRLPIDSGKLLLEATESLALRGRVTAQAPFGGRGGPVDISSPVDILIGGKNAEAAAGTLVLNARELSRFGAESLLIGGVREFGANGTKVTITTGNLTVDNAGSRLSGPEIILVARENLTLSAGAEISQSGTLSSPAERLIFGSSNVAGSGDGTMFRLSSDSTATSSRLGLSASLTPTLNVGAGVILTGNSITLDSTAGASLDAAARLDASTVTLNSGRISIALDDTGALQLDPGLVLSGSALAGLQSANTLNLLSYSSIDIYGTGTVSAGGTLALRAAELRGFDNGGGTARFSARKIVLDNKADGTVSGAVADTSGTLAFDAGKITIGSNDIRIDQFANVSMDARGGLAVTGEGDLFAQGAVTISTPLITGARAADHSIVAGGALTIAGTDATATVRSGLGAKLELTGTSITAGGDIRLPSGQITLRATTGDVTVSGRLNANGTTQIFHDLARYTGAGKINLIAENGSVSVNEGAVLSVVADRSDAGAVMISAPKGSFEIGGEFSGAAENGGRNGVFGIDVSAITEANLTALNAKLNDGGFTQSRAFRIRTGDVTIGGVAQAREFSLSADGGSITVTGVIDASGTTGGTIDLNAAGSLVLASGSRLTVAADRFNAAQKGGAVFLGAGSAINGIIDPTAVLDIQGGSSIALGVAASSINDAAFGRFTGTLHLRAPQNSTSTDIQIAAIDGAITGASSIVAEGFKVFDLTGTGGAITSTVQANVKANGESFLGAAGTTTGQYTDMVARLLANNASLSPKFSMQTGAELINRTGDLTLGTPTSTPTSDWDLSTFRFGPQNAPGTLTMRAAGNLVFYNALSDGFTSSAYDAALLAFNPLLGANVQSWSYRLAAGADLSSADVGAVQSTSALDAAKGTLLLGKNYGTNVFLPSGSNAQTRTAVQNRFQVIRTGSGNIKISASRDVQLLDQFATIYTAGTQLADPTKLPGGNFDLPILDASGGQTTLGSVQQNPGYPAQYSLGGGNVTITAGNDIARYTRDTAGNLIADSSKQLPVNWLYRRGYVDPVTGQFGVGRFGDVASTTWWVDYSNFFEGVGALGGGNVTLIAGRDISNVDAVVPTNARMAKGAPNASNMVELGGGDITVRAGRNIDAGVYYVERGAGTLQAGGSIVTNSTRSPSRGSIVNPAETYAPATWLPTTLFAGKASFDVSASGDLLLGPTVNPFLIPGGYNNTYWYKTYFSTYAPDSSVNVVSLGGDITFRLGATLPTSGPGAVTPILQAYMQNISLFRTNPQSVSFYQPWLRLNESSTAPFTTLLSLMTPNVSATAFSSNIGIVGDMTLAPAPRGTVDLVAAGSLLGLQPNGVSNTESGTVVTWGSSTINLSDADPDRVPGIASPFAYQTIAGTAQALARQTGTDFLLGLDRLFAETGSASGPSSVLQVKQALHAPGVLHRDDPNPIHIYADRGDITGFTLFSGKSARIVAGRDITDNAFYLQNTGQDDISLVAAGRDIVAYNANASQRLQAQSDGNLVNFRDERPLAGDIQISGPGTLEVLAGRNLDLGVSPINPDGTGAGITSIGNARNPALPLEGARIVAGAGIGPAFGLERSGLDFDGFIDQIFESDAGDRYLAELGERGLARGIDSRDELEDLPTEKRNLIALAMFYLALRDAGRDQPTTGMYDPGFAAVDALFAESSWQGDLSLTSRQIKTSAGGDVSLFAPGGEVIVGFDAAGEQSADQGILTEAGGNISIFADGSITVGTSRIFTLRGGNEIIWSSNGDIAAGSAAKTVQSAPPTRVIIDPQTGDVATDLAGLATGGGIGVLATVKNVPPGDVDLIAPRGAIDAGDAGIRVSGNLRIAATQVLNASNIQAAGASTGVPSSPTVAAPNLGSLSAASNTAGATNSAASNTANQNRSQAAPEQTEVASIVTVEVLGYGGGEGSASPSGDDDEEERKRRQQENVESAPVGNASINDSGKSQSPS